MVETRNICPRWRHRCRKRRCGKSSNGTINQRSMAETLLIMLVFSFSSSPSRYMTDAYSISRQPQRTPQQQRRKPPLTFQEFEFAPNGVCTFPQFFVEYPSPNTSSSDSNEDSSSSSSNPRYCFTMRNVPGEGDCMFLAVALAAATSMGLGANDALLRAISRETRSIVAQILSSSGNLYISPGQIVPASKLLQSAVQSEPGIAGQDEYLDALRKEGREGGLYGGGPELAVLANVLRRPISIYEVDKPRLKALHEKADNGIELDDNLDASLFPIVCKGSFGEGVFEDPCLTSIPDSAVLSNIQPGAYSWRLHILVLTVSPGEKHACVLLPQQQIVGQEDE